MGVAEFKRRFSDIIGEVSRGGDRIIVERRGKPLAAFVPLDQVDTRTPGQRLAAVVGFGGADGDEFCEFMNEVVRERRNRMPRPVSEMGE
jgi:prevent-host-death family protein